MIHCPSCAGNAENSAYVSKVFDFVPAPGQFINQLPAHETNDDSAAIIKKVGCHHMRKILTMRVCRITTIKMLEIVIMR